jgi:hypothetical protein
MMRKPEDLPRCDTKNAFGGKERCACRNDSFFVMSSIRVYIQPPSTKVGGFFTSICKI